MENQQQPNQPPPYNQQQQGGFYVLPPVPNSTGVLVLGILSIVFCWLWGIAGLIMGIIALSMAGKGDRLYKDYPGQYSPASYSNLKAGRVCAIIGTILSALYVIIIAIYIAILGAAISSLPWDQMGH